MCECLLHWLYWKLYDHYENMRQTRGEGKNLAILSVKREVEVSTLQFLRHLGF